MFIRSKVRGKIMAALQGDRAEPSLDGSLLWNIINTRLQPSTNPDLYRPYPSRALAAQVEEKTAHEIATTYLQIKEQAVNPLIQALNRLL